MQSLRNDIINEKFWKFWSWKIKILNYYHLAPTKNIRLDEKMILFKPPAHEIATNNGTTGANLPIATFAKDTATASESRISSTDKTAKYEMLTSIYIIVTVNNDSIIARGRFLKL